MRRLGLLVFGAIFVALFATVAISEGLGEPDVPSGDVAMVESVPSEISSVSKEKFGRAMQRAALQAGLKEPPKPSDGRFEEMKEAALVELLETIWIQGQAEEMGIEIGRKQIVDELEQIKDQTFKSEAEYKKFLKTSRFTEEDALERVKLQVLSERIQQQLTNTVPLATDTEIEDYYEDELEAQFTESAARVARVIVNEDEAKIEEAKAELEKDNSPANWKKIAAKFSEDPNTKDKGGLQAGLTEDLLQSQPELSEAIFGNDAGAIVGPTEVATKFFLTEVVKLKPAKTQDLEEVRAQIKSKFDQQLQKEFFSGFSADYKSKWEARTICADGFVIEKCSNYVGDGHPSDAPAACYEVEQQGAEPVDCPAPVQQAAPAIPGSVTQVNPQGERLQQRPRPVGLKERSQGLSLPEGAQSSE